MMTEVAIALAVVGAVLVGMLISFRRFMRRTAQADAKLHELPRTAVGALAEGARVRVVGKAIPAGELVKAPYSGKMCLAYRASSSAQLGDTNNYGGKSIRSPESQGVRPFRVQDETGAIEIDLAHVTLELSRNFVSDQDAERHAFGAKILAREAQSVTYREYLLLANEDVAVIGRVRRSDQGSLGLAGNAGEPLVVSNRSAALQ